MNWKKEIKEKLNQATLQRKISTPLKKLVKLLLIGDTPFILVYSSSKDVYYDVRFKETITITTARVLILSGYKRFYINRK